MGLRCWLGWHGWEPVTPFRLINPAQLMGYPDLMCTVPVRLERCKRCECERGRASTPGGHIDADLGLVKFIVSGYEAEDGLAQIKVRGPVRRLDVEDDHEAD